MITVVYCLIQFAYYLAFCSIINYASVYLTACGLSNTLIGVTIAVGMIASVFITPVISSIADRNHAITPKKILIVMLVLLGISGLLMTVFFHNGSTINAVLLCLAVILTQVSMPFVNALATESINAGVMINFGLARGAGSIGYSVMSFTLGSVVASHSPRSIPIATLISCAVFCIFTLLYNDKVRSSAVVRTSANKESIFAFLKRYKGLTALLIGASLVYACHMYINTYVFQIVLSKGGNSRHMGIATSLAAFLEMTAMVVFPYLLTLRDCKFWFKISGFFFMLKSLMTLLVKSIPAFYAVQVIQPFGWGLLAVSSVYYINDLMNENDKIKGQGFFSMTFTIGSIISSVTGGYLIDKFSVDFMLIVAVAAGIIGSLILFFNKVKKKGCNLIVASL